MEPLRQQTGAGEHEQEKQRWSKGQILALHSTAMPQAAATKSQCCPGLQLAVPAQSHIPKGTELCTYKHLSMVDALEQPCSRLAFGSISSALNSHHHQKLSPPHDKAALKDLKAHEFQFQSKGVLQALRIYLHHNAHAHVVEEEVCVFAIPCSLLVRLLALLPPAQQRTPSSSASTPDKKLPFGQHSTGSGYVDTSRPALSTDLQLQLQLLSQVQAMHSAVGLLMP
ncbi:hypothetical protein Anapl_15205 [Anas platyrhynchos]|uniref:Uncharacterized protein n=1 Tax=Anas platyrhynchos TaxID=8839 RepID=R0L6T9_ANAPL|nr:hypothetical protein Anapl_15205 [Anas platyrhynchos]